MPTLGKCLVTAIGKPKSSHALPAVEHYRRLASGLFALETAWLKGATARNDGEAERLRAMREDTSLLLERTGGFRVFLTERGKLLNSRDLAASLRTQLDRGAHLSFLVGGPFGLDPELESRADLCWALSPLTFPHEMALALLFEQLYRAGTILMGKAYHY